MSIEIDWDGIVNDHHLNTQLQDFLNEHVQNLELPSYLSHLHITNFSLGDKAPQITIRHVGDPFKEFYEHTNGKDNDADYDHGHDSPESDSKSKSKSESDIQFIVELNFNSDIYMELDTNLLLNYPSTNFISLPIKLKFTKLFIHSLLSITVIDKKVFISFLYDIEDNNEDESNIDPPPSADQPVPPSPLNSRSNSYMGYNSSAANFSTQPNATSTTNFLNNLNPALNNQNSNRIDIIKQLKIESEVGQTQNIDGSILRNIGKIEKFLVELLKDLIITELAWPSWLELDFNDDDDNDDDDDETNDDNGNDNSSNDNDV